MATSPFGGYPDLMPRRAASMSQAVNPLEELIQGLSQYQQFGQQQAQQQLANQLALQLQQGRISEQNLRLEALKRAVPTEQQNALQNAILASQLRQAGVIEAPIVRGQPAALPALPVDQGVFEALPDLPSGQVVPQEVSPLARPVTVGSRQVFDPETLRAQQTQARRLEAMKKREETPLTFKEKGGTVVGLDPFTGEERSRTTLGTDEELFEVKDVGSFIGVKNKPDTWKPVGGKGGGAGAAEEYTAERARRSLDSISDLRTRVSRFNVGYGSLLDFLPESDALDFKGRVDTLKGSIAFGELQAMRNASKTGGALGQVAVQELKLLESALGSLNTRQSRKSFIENLDKIEKSIARFSTAKNKFSETNGDEGRVKVNSQAEYDALDEDTPYIDSKGVRGTKPKRAKKK